MDWQQELETGQFAMEQSWEDGFRWVYEGAIAQMEEEVVWSNLILMVPRADPRITGTLAELCTSTPPPLPI